jgi:hypothetical protein
MVRRAHSAWPFGKKSKGQFKAGYSVLFIKVVKGLAREFFCVVAYDVLDW